MLGGKPLTSFETTRLLHIRSQWNALIDRTYQLMTNPYVRLDYDRDVTNEKILCRPNIICNMCSSSGAKCLTVLYYIICGSRKFFILTFQNFTRRGGCERSSAPLEMCVCVVWETADCAMQGDSRFDCCSERTHDGLIKKLRYIEILVIARE